MFCIELGMIGLGQSEVEHYARGGGLFDEDKINRDDSGMFAPKSKGGGATIDDAPFALGQAKSKKGKGSHEKQGSLFDSDLHGAEARDLPGQTNFLGEEPEDTPATSGIDKSDAPGNEDDETPEELEKLAMANDMGMPPENAIGTKAHRLRSMKRLKEFGLSDKSAKWVFQQAMETRHDFDGFGAALKAYAGTAQGIESAPAPAGKKSKGKADWSGRDASGVVDKDTAKLFGA